MPVPQVFENRCVPWHKSVPQVVLFVCRIITLPTRSWFPKELLHSFVDSVGEETVRRIIVLVRQYQWNGCPDLVFWNGSHIRFVEVKSSTDTLKEDQIIVRDELTSAGFHYAVAVTQDACGKRRMRGDRARAGS